MPIYKHCCVGYCFMLVLLVLTARSSAQSAQDSLERVLENKDLPAADQTMILVQLSRQVYFAGNTSRADQLIRQAIHLARPLPDGQGAAYAYAARAMQLRLADSVSLSIQSMDSATYFAHQTSSQTIKGYVNYAKGWIASRNNRPNEAISSFLEGLADLKDEENTQANNYKASIYYELSAIYADWNDLDNLLKYARLSYDLALRAQKTDAMTDALQMLASCFERQHAQDSTKVDLLDSALFYNKASIRVFQARPGRNGVPSQLALSALNTANIYLNMTRNNKQYTDSIAPYLRIALNQGKATGQYTVVAAGYGILSDLSMRNGSISNAEKYLQMALYSLHKMTIPDRAIESEIHLKLSEISEKKGNLQDALSQFREHMALEKQQYDAGKLEIGKRLEAQYEVKQKEAQLRAFRKQLALGKKLNRVYIVLAIASLLALILLYYFFRQRTKTIRQQEQLHLLEIEQIHQQHRIQRLSAMIEGQENERLRLARDLHDGLGGMLSGIKLEWGKAAPAALDQAIEEMRRIAHNMMPEVLLQYGLAEAIREYCSRFRKQGFQITFQHYHYQNDMPVNRQIVMFRIAQELVNNALKHANATHILVQLQQSGSTITLTVEDDGKGFEPDETERTGHSGIRNIQSRAEFLNATLEMQSQPGMGTSISIECDV